MSLAKNKFITLVSLLFSGTMLLNACGVQSATTGSATIPPAALIVSDDRTNEKEIRFYENKVKNDAEDYSANNKLAGLYLQKLRETGDVTLLNLAFRAVRASLDSVPDVRNSGGLAALALCEFASHDFTNSRDHALRLIELEPSKSYPQSILGDALVELGEYEKAEIAYKKITLLDKGSSSGSESRFARIAQLEGDNAEAQKHFADALKLTLNQSFPPRETVAWLRWQLGETAFSIGDYKTAEKDFQDSLTTFPDYHRAVASLGKVRAAQGDLQGAIEQYEKVTRILPDPNYVAALGDLYELSGRETDAKRQYELVEQIGRLSELNGALYNRQLALFYADHDLKPAEAFQLAAKEYETRKDIYGADALAWTALKAGKNLEAQTAIKDALRLNTQDAKLFYHAGMIARAVGDDNAARQFLQKTLALNPAFDLLQAANIKSILNPN
ncbi:MAG: tetratricopeptide repeat protein [Acidobacteriota bacterium]|nr:tetratricopeptide repeat protein [Acidobacteriota bacterium]